MTDKPFPSCVHRWRRLSRWGLAVLIIAGLAFVARAPILRGMAAPLIIADSSATVSGMLVLGGNQRFSEAARFHETNPAGNILLLKQSPGRLERYHIVPPPTDVARQELVRRGVNPDRLAIITSLENDDSPYRALARWLDDHPDAHLIVLFDAYSSRELRWRLDREFSKDLAIRLSVRPVASLEFDQSKWWTSKRGISEFVRGWLGLILPIVQRGHQLKWRECNPEMFHPSTT